MKVELLMILLLLSRTFSYSFPSHLFHLDGKYCFEFTDDDKTTERRSCNYFIDLRTKYPFIIVSQNLGEEKDSEDNIRVVKPAFWPNITHQQSENPTIEFTIENYLHNLSLKLTSSLQIISNCSDISHFVIQTNGILHLSILCLSQPQANFILRRVKSHSLKHMIRNNLCDINSILPGHWKIDQSLSNRDEDKSNTCPINYQERYHIYHCPVPYYAAQYYPDSGCSIMPLRLSLYLLYHYFERENILMKSHHAIQKNTTFLNPFYTFIGDSLNAQIMDAGNCELESHHNSLSVRKQYSHDHALDGNDITISPQWNQYLRNDYPCQPQCLTNQTFAQTDGKIRPHSYLPPPCKGCSNHVKMTGKLEDHPEAFAYLQNIPQETKIVVINGGAWFSEHFLVQNGTTVFRETLEALLPQVAKLQRERNYNLDLYFLTLPGVDPTTAKETSFDWAEYEKRNRIILDVFSQNSLTRYNITITLIHNDRFFVDRKTKIDGNMITTPDQLHYCVPGPFSPPSFLFEVIFHFHVRNRLKQEGFIE